MTRMKTFLSWLIANLEVAASVVILAVYIPIYVHGIKSELGSETDGLTGFIVGLSFLLLIPAFLTSKNFWYTLFSFLILVAGYILVGCIAPYATEDAYFQKALIKLVIGGILSFALAIPVGIFTARNMDDVVSLRMLYVNSDVDMFDMTLQDSLNRFMVAFIYFSWAILAGIAYGVLMYAGTLTVEA